MSKQNIRVKRIRGKIKKNNAIYSRISVFVSNKNVSAHLYDSVSGNVVCGVTSASRNFDKSGDQKEVAKKLGKQFGELLSSKKLSNIVFDRGGKKYTGVVKSFADAARETGLKF